MCCKTLNTNNRFTSFTTGCKFVFNEAGTFNCKTKFVVYLITCKKCGVQYVGQTRQELHTRLNGHRHSVMKNSLNTFLCKHFNSEGHSFEDLSIQIIDVVDSASMTFGQAIRELDLKEDYYIRTLNTMHPLGLNDRFLGGGCISLGSVREVPFFQSPVKRRLRSHGVRKSGRKKLCVEENYFNNLSSEMCDLFLAHNYSGLYRLLSQLSKSKLQIVYTLLAKTNNELACIVSSLILNKFKRADENAEAVDRITFSATFNCRNVDLINLPSVFRDKRLVRLLPEPVREHYPPRVYFKLNAPIALKLCNYSRFLAGLNISEIQDILNNSCICDSKPDFVCHAYGHIVTGDLEVVENHDVRFLLKKGAKFRIPRVQPWSTVVQELKLNIDSHISVLARKFKLTEERFDQWREKFISMIWRRIRNIKQDDLAYGTSNLKSLKDLETDIQAMHKNFVITTIDKANNNFGVVCKKFYVSVLVRELGFDTLTLNPVGNTTYSPSSETSEEIITRHVDTLKNKFDVKVQEKNFKLPKLFWIPKLHKNPIKFRFIAGARNCSTKPLSVLLNKGLSVIRNQFLKYCESIYRNSGINCFWSVKSSFEFLSRINGGAVHTLQVYDFSTLYTNLNQQEILVHLFDLFDLVFNCTSRKYLCIGWNNSFMAGKTYRGHHCFDINDLKAAIKFIISEVYISFGGLAFQQVKGIPMGGNCSPLLADLFLLHCEFQFMKSAMSDKKFHLAKLLSRTSRYIDDLCIVNYRHFEDLITKIYPHDLSADRNGSDNKSVDYLDVKLTINDSGVHTSVYHKVDDFSFPVILLTHPESLIPYNMGLQVFAGQVLRYIHICSDLKYVIEKVNKTKSVLIERGYRPSDLSRALEKMLSKHCYLLMKFGIFSYKHFVHLCDLR